MDWENFRCFVAVKFYVDIEIIDFNIIKILNIQSPNLKRSWFFFRD